MKSKKSIWIFYYFLLQTHTLIFFSDKIIVNRPNPEFIVYLPSTNFTTYNRPREEPYRFSLLACKLYRCIGVGLRQDDWRPFVLRDSLGMYNIHTWHVYIIKIHYFFFGIGRAVADKSYANINTTSIYNIFTNIRLEYIIFIKSLYLGIFGFLYTYV